MQIGMWCANVAGRFQYAEDDGTEPAANVEIVFTALFVLKFLQAIMFLGWASEKHVPATMRMKHAMHQTTIMRAIAHLQCLVFVCLSSRFAE